MEQPVTKPAVKIRCGRCGYEWETKSKMGYVTCPNCRYNNPVGIKFPKRPKPAKEPRVRKPRPRKLKQSPPDPVVAPAAAAGVVPEPKEEH